MVYMAYLYSNMYIIFISNICIYIYGIPAQKPWVYDQKHLEITGKVNCSEM